MRNLGILHPGAMGSGVAAAAVAAGAAVSAGRTVWWASEGRSDASRARAERAGLRDAGTLAALCGRCELILSVCPPHAAEDVADAVLATGYRGLYLDANAIAPQRVRRMAEKMSAAGATLVDGGIIGGPPWKPGTQLYLAGPQAEAVAACFAGSPLEAIVIGDQAGKASALKMVYAAWTKGSAALLAGLLATAQAQGVWDELMQQWDRDRPGNAQANIRRVTGAAARAWRWEGEMREIAATFADAGQPEGFHLAAAEIYQRLAEFKDVATPPEIEDMLAALRG
jgi:3-hydroxyisobutyrate dehydrogenase-like beta-hydroxyacid dehydrogenase